MPKSDLVRVVEAIEKRLERAEADNDRLRARVNHLVRLLRAREDDSRDVGDEPPSSARRRRRKPARGQHA